MAAQWYCLIGQQQYGPFTSEQIRQLVQQGQLQQEHFVRTETDTRWTSAGDLPGLFPPPQAAPNPPSVPSVTTKPKKKTVVPAVSIPAPPTAQAPAAVPFATPMATPPSAIPVAAPIAAAPIAAAPIAAAPVAAAPVAAAPIAAAPIAAARPVPAPAGPAQARTAPAARPIPLTPIVPPVAAPGAARGSSGEQGSATPKRRRRKNSQLVVGGLGAALVLLIVVAVVVLNRVPSQGPDQRPGTALFKDPGGDPEIETPMVMAAASEPTEIADPVLASVTAAGQPGSEAKSAGLPPVTKWLGAARQKGGLREVVRLGVGNAWRDSADGQPDVLNVEIQITNLSPDKPLEFSSWRPDVQPRAELRAVMVDDEDTLLPASPPRTAARRPAAVRRIAPGQSETEQLSFLVPERESKQFRLALPYAALGQVGYLGFELPVQMIRGRPPGEEQVATEEPPTITPETLLPAAGDAPEMEEEEIEQEREEAIPDIRKLIEDEERPAMEPPQEQEPNEKQPTAETEFP
jgi:hypothetical protein